MKTRNKLSLVQTLHLRKLAKPAILYVSILLIISMLPIFAINGVQAALPTVTAKSGSVADIQAAVNSLGSTGGNVYVPAGTFYWSASDNIRIPGGVNLFGASPAGNQGHEFNWAANTASTIIHKNAATFTSGMISLDGSNGKSSRVSGIQLEANPINGGSDSDNNYGIGITITGMVDYRVDHCTFKNFIQIAVFVGSTSAITSRGVLDHNTVDNPYKLSGGPYYWGYGFYVANDYFQISNWNTNAALFFGHYSNLPAKTTMMVAEDNHFSRCRHSTDGISGGYGIVRFNLMDNSVPPYGDIDSHGSASWVSARGFEAYNNTIIEQSGASDSGYGNGDIAVRLRDGSGLIYNNTFVVTPSNTGSAYFLYLDNDNSYYGTYPITEVSQTYIWSNSVNGASLLNNRGGYTQNTNYFLRAPTQAQDGFTYTPYQYPSPLTLDESNQVPTASPTPVPTASPTPVPTASPTPVPTASPTPVPTASPTPVPTASPTPRPTASPTPVPTASPTPRPTASPTPVPTASPTPVPTASPTPRPTATPTPVPTVSPTPRPTATPTPTPSPTPSPQPSETNIVQNGGFDSGISPWKLEISDSQSQGYAGTLMQSSNAYSGSYSGLFTVTGYPQGGSGYITVLQTLPAKQGQTYTLQFYYKGTMQVFPHVFCFDSSWSRLGLFSTPTLSATSTWSLATMTFLVPSGTATTQIHFDVSSTGTFQVDNVFVTDPQTPSPTPTPTPEPTPTQPPTQKVAVSSVTASSYVYNHRPSQAIDGVQSTSNYWGSNNLVTSGKLPQWLRLDLGTQTSIRQITTHFYDGSSRTYTYYIQASTDGSNWSTIVPTKTGSSIVTDTFNQVTARYVRITITGNTADLGAQIEEISIYK